MKRVALILGLLLCISWALGRSAAAGPAVVIESIEGDGVVQIDGEAHGAAGSDRQRRRLIAQEGDTVEEGDRVLTSGAAARLRYPDGSRLRLADGAQLEVQRPQAGAPAVELHGGNVRATVQKAAAPGPAAPHKFFIRAGAVVMGVRGTEFVVDLDGAGRVSLHTLEGLVEVGRSQEDLRRGAGLRVGAEQWLRAGRDGIGPVSSFDRGAFLGEQRARHLLGSRLDARGDLRRGLDQIQRDLREADRGGPGRGGAKPGRGGEKQPPGPPPPLGPQSPLSPSRGPEGRR